MDEVSKTGSRKPRNTDAGKPGQVRRTKRQRRRTAWHVGCLEECAVGREEHIGDDMTVTRVKRKPPTWLVQRYVDGEPFHLLLMKGAPGTMKSFGWNLSGKGYMTMHSSRASALRAAATVVPVFEEEEATDDEASK